MEKRRIAKGPSNTGCGSITAASIALSQVLTAE
jgi:hypothetical protein